MKIIETSILSLLFLAIFSSSSPRMRAEACNAQINPFHPNNNGDLQLQRMEDQMNALIQDVNQWENQAWQQAKEERERAERWRQLIERKGVEMVQQLLEEERARQGES